MRKLVGKVVAHLSLQAKKQSAAASCCILGYEPELTSKEQPQKSK